MPGDYGAGAFERGLFGGLDLGVRNKEFRARMAHEKAQEEELKRQRETQEYGTLGTSRENIQLAQNLRASGRQGPLMPQEQFATEAEQNFQKRLSARYGGRPISEHYSTSTLRQAIKDLEDRKTAGVSLDQNEENTLDEYNRELQRRLLGHPVPTAPKTKNTGNQPTPKKGFLERAFEGVGGAFGAAAGGFREKMKGPKPAAEDERAAVRRRLGLK